MHHPHISHEPLSYLVIPCANMIIGSVGGVFIKNGIWATVKISTRGGVKYIARHGWKTGLVLTGIVAAAEIGINAIIANIKSRYYDHTIIEFDTSKYVLLQIDNSD